MNTITLIGLISGLMTTFSFLPQIIKIIKTKDAKSISLWMTIIYTLGVCGWIFYGYELDNIVLLITNSFSLLFGLALLILKLKYGKQENVLHISNKMFEDSKPMGGLEYELFCDVLKATSPDKPTLPNRK